MLPKPHRASIVFYVADIERTENFYNQVLGLDLVRQEGAEPFWLSGSLDQGLEIIFFEMEGERGNTPALVFDLTGGGIDDIVACNTMDIDPENAVVAVIVTIRDLGGEPQITVNLRAPILLDAGTRTGWQYVLPNARYPVRHPLNLDAAAGAADGGK